MDAGTVFGPALPQRARPSGGVGNEVEVNTNRAAGQAGVGEQIGCQYREAIKISKKNTASAILLADLPGCWWSAHVYAEWKTG